MKLTALKPRTANRLPDRAAPLPANPGATPRLYGRAAVDRRARWFALYPLCVQCQAAGAAVPVPMATQLDHVIPLETGGADDESNLQGLCEEHHAAKTKREAIERARRRRGAG